MSTNDINILLLLAFVLIATLIIRVGTRWRYQDPPRWMEQANGPLKPHFAKALRGYDPVVKPRMGYDVETVDLGRL